MSSPWKPRAAWIDRLSEYLKEDSDPWAGVCEINGCADRSVSWYRSADQSMHEVCEVHRRILPPPHPPLKKEE